MQDSADKHDLFKVISLFLFYYQILPNSKDSPRKEENEEGKEQKTLDEYYGEQQWVVVGNKGQEKSKEDQMKKELEIEKMAKDEKLEIVEKKKETEEEA